MEQLFVRREFELTNSRRVEFLRQPTQPDSPTKPNRHENHTSDYNYNHNYDIITLIQWPVYLLPAFSLGAWDLVVGHLILALALT